MPMNLTPETPRWNDECKVKKWKLRHLEVRFFGEFFKKFLPPVREVGEFGM